MKTPQQICAAAADLIASPEAWLKREIAQTADRILVQPEHPDACRFCMLGALDRASFNEAGNANITMYKQAHALAMRVLKTDARGRYFENIGSFNDSIFTTHAEVLALLRKAAS